MRLSLYTYLYLLVHVSLTLFAPAAPRRCTAACRVVLRRRVCQERREHCSFSEVTVWPFWDKPARYFCPVEVTTHMQRSYGVKYPDRQGA